MPRQLKIKNMIRGIEAYVAENRDALPILKECCLKNGWDYDELLELADKHPDLKKAVNMLQTQKEVNLEKGGIYGTFNKPMAAKLLEQAEQEKLEKTRFRALEHLDEILCADENAAVKKENEIQDTQRIDA